MKLSNILLLALSLVLIVCLVLVLRSCMVGRTVVEATIPPSSPKATLKPIRTPEPIQFPSPTPKPSPTPEPKLPFAQEKGFRFEEPTMHSIPVTQTSSLGTEAKYKSTRAMVSAPRITRSEPDDEGWVTYEIHYTTTADASFVMPSGKSVDAYYLFAGGYDLIDFYSGRILNSRDSGALLDERTYTRETELDIGEESITVEASEQAQCSWGEWQFVEDKDRVSAANRAVVDALLTVRAPADYDGLVLGLDIAAVQQIPEGLFSGDEVREETADVWGGRTEDWIFVRADEWLVDELYEPEDEADEDDAEEPQESSESEESEEPNDTEEPDEPEEPEESWEEEET